MKVRELVMIEMAPYNDVKRRGFEFHASNLMVEDFARATHGGRNVHPGAINTLAAGVLKQTTVPQQTSMIENGWGSRRYNFILQIEHDVPMGANTKIVQYLSGYTDSVFDMGILTFDRINLPPDLMFRFTNNITVSETVGFDASGKRVVKATPQDVYNILYGAYDPERHNVEYSTRVQDTLAYTSTSRWIGSGVDSNEGMDADMQSIMRKFSPGSATVVGNDPNPRGNKQGDLYGIDGSVSFGADKVKQAHATSVMPTDFLGKTFRAMSLARDTSVRGSSVGAEVDQLLSFASQNVREKSLVSDTTLGAFQRDMSLSFDGTVDWHSLRSMFGNNIDDVTRVFPHTQVQTQRRQEMVQTGLGELGWAPKDSASWDVLDYETTVGSAFATQLPAAMSDRLVETARFTADNHGRPGSHIRPGMWAVDIRDCQSYITGYDRNAAAVQLSAMLESTVLPSISSEVGLPISITCGADLFMETQFNISINGGQKRPFTMPNCAPCAYSPLMTRDIGQVHKLSNDLVNLVALVTDTNNF